MHACFQLGLSAVVRLLSSRAGHKVMGVLGNVSYRVDHIRITVSGYVSYCGKMFHCRPTHYNTIMLTVAPIVRIFGKMTDQ